MTRELAVFFVSAFGVHAAAVEADSARGAALFDSLSCIQCHSVNGKGGTAAPDLGRRIDRNFTPASLAATMWNHAPTMWAAMRARNLAPGDLNEQAARDLFAFFYSARFFEKLGDAGRGKRLFASKHCAECHGLTDTKLAAAKPVSQWEALGRPLELVNALWNHAAAMREEFAKKKLEWSDLTSQDLADMVVYLRNVPSSETANTRFEISSGANAQALFDSKGCAACHSGKYALTSRLKGKTLTDIAVEMWEHAPRMRAASTLSLAEMREILSYLWAEQFFEDAGNPSSGARVFTAKNCGSCHNQPTGGAPRLTAAGRTFTAATIVSALWRHGPQMLDQMKTRGVAWPRFEGSDMANLIAYLNAQNNSQPRAR